MTKDHARKKAIRVRMAASGEPYSVAARNLDAAGPASDAPASDAAAASEIVACARSTLAEPSARIEFHLDWNLPMARSRVERLIRRVGRTVWEFANRGLDPGDRGGEGFLEPATGRCMIDWGGYAQLWTEGKIFDGRSGRSLQALPRGRKEVGPVPWLLRLLAGTTDARPEGAETLRGTLCRKFAVQVDTARAAAANGATLPTPAGVNSSQPQELALTVWIDGQHIRRVWFEDGAKPELREFGVSKELTLELWDFGVSVEQLDWSRLPSIKTPG